jgi:hemolysin III
VWYRGGPLAVGLPIAGGLDYTLGTTGFERQWPTHRPATFPHHDVWHAFTIAAAGLHFTAIWTVAT